MYFPTCLFRFGSCRIRAGHITLAYSIFVRFDGCLFILTVCDVRQDVILGANKKIVTPTWAKCKNNLKPLTSSKFNINNDSIQFLNLQTANWIVFCAHNPGIWNEIIYFDLNFKLQKLLGCIVHIRIFHVDAPEPTWEMLQTIVLNPKICKF